MRRPWAILVAPLALAGVAAAPRTADQPTVCVVSGFVLVASSIGGPSLQFLPRGGREGCLGAYPFLGVSPAELGSPPRTLDDYPELAGALLHWTPADGTPAVDQWVNLAPAVQQGLQRAGIDPTGLLQWWNQSLPGFAGSFLGPGQRNVWPPFVPRGLVRDPRRLVRRRPPTAAGSRALAVGASSVSPPAVSRRALPWPVGTASAPSRPPTTVVWEGVRVPCPVAPSCKVQRRDGRRWGWVGGGLGVLVAAAACVLAARRRALGLHSARR